MSLKRWPSSSEHRNVLAGQESSRLKIKDAAGIYVAIVAGGAVAVAKCRADVEPATRPSHIQLRLNMMVVVEVRWDGSTLRLARLGRTTDSGRSTGWAGRFSVLLQVVQSCKRWKGSSQSLSFFFLLSVP
jgi:hypothetical protein